MKLLEPWMKADNVASIDLDFLRRNGVDTILLDMDNTVVPWHTFAVGEATGAWIQRAKMLGLRVCILSNNQKWRILKLTEMLDVHGVWGACKPLAGGYLKAIRKVGSKRHTSVFVGDQVFTDIFGANLLGIRTILVHPLSRQEFTWTRIMRKLETWLTGRAFDGKAEQHGK